MQENQHIRKLKEAIEGYWMGPILEIDSKNGKYFEQNELKQNEKKSEYEKYLKLRVRPLMEYLIEKEDIDKMEDVAEKGWFTAAQLDGFLKIAGEKHCLSSFAWLLQWKKHNFGFKDRDFSL